MPQNPTMKLSAEDLRALRWVIKTAQHCAYEPNWFRSDPDETGARCDAARAVVDRLAAASEPEPEMEASPFDRMHLRDLQSQVDGLQSQVDRQFRELRTDVDLLQSAKSEEHGVGVVVDLSDGRRGRIVWIP